MRREDQSTEFKETYVDDIKKTVVAFANTDGGTIFVGVDDSGRVVGVDDVDKTILRAQNALRDAIKPDVTMHVSCSAREVENKTIIVVEVQKGTSCPYYLADKGIRPAGVYVRQGPSSVPASEAAILQMIRETDGGSYENARSLEQSLSFSEAETAFEGAGLTFGEGKAAYARPCHRGWRAHQLGAPLVRPMPAYSKARCVPREEEVGVPR